MKKTLTALMIILISIAASAKDSKAPANSIHVIFPYNVQGIWAFDDDARGLVREPFVGAINPMVDKLVENIPDAKFGFRLLFSAGFIPDYDAKLVWTSKEHSGDWYYCEKFKNKGWLCPALLKYFPSAPKQIYVKAEPLPKALTEARKKRPKKIW